ncbi:MAG: hypothetical protein AAFV71_25905 [Cyanobacteria bacterium J06633_8]
MPRFGKAFGYCFPIIVNNSNNKIMLDDLRLPKSLTKKVEKIVDGFRSPAIVEDENTHIYKFSAKVYTGNTYTQNPVGMCGEAYYCRVIKSDEPLEQDELEEILVQFVAELKERYRLQTVCPLGYWNANKDFERII